MIDGFPLMCITTYGTLRPATTSSLLGSSCHPCWNSSKFLSLQLVDWSGGLDERNWATVWV
ncbi:unnamed protein product, partial [Vitis vinifera]